MNAKVTTTLQYRLAQEQPNMVEPFNSVEEL